MLTQVEKGVAGTTLPKKKTPKKKKNHHHPPQPQGGKQKVLFWLIEKSKAEARSSTRKGPAMGKRRGAEGGFPGSTRCSGEKRHGKLYKAPIKNKIHAAEDAGLECDQEACRREKTRISSKKGRT